VNECLKEGGLFVGYEWTVLPDRGYDKDNTEHVRIKEGIEVGNGYVKLHIKLLCQPCFSDISNS